MLDVDGREHVDPRLEHIAHILIPLLVLDPRRVRVRELVDQAQLGFAREHRRQVHLLQRRPPVDDAPAGNDLQSLGLRDGLRPPVGLEVADDNIAPVLGLGGALLQHPVGLADPRGHPDEDLQVPAISDRAVAGALVGRRSVGVAGGRTAQAPSRLWTIRSISLIPMNGAMIPPSP